MSVRLKDLPIVVGGLAVLLAVSASAFPQSDAASLTVRFAGGINQFHVGEVIPVELSFTALLADSYDMDTRNYDRSGRLDMEQFHVTPSGRDPLVNYYADGGGHWGRTWRLASAHE